MLVTAINSDPPDDAVQTTALREVGLDEANEVLITVQEVRLATAAVVGVPQRTSRWARVAALLSVSRAPRPAGDRLRHYTSRRDYTENARMAREMDRL